MVVLLYNIRSLHNVGSIFRTADAAGIKKLYLCGITPAPVDNFGKPRSQLTKVSLGAEKYVEYASTSSAQVASTSSAQIASARSAAATAKLLEKLKKEGYKIFAIEQSPKSIPYNKVKIRRTGKNKDLKICLVVGNEIKGLPLFILRRADKILEIPMKGTMVRQAHHPRRTGRGKESLNVAVAFGIVAFSLRQ